MTDYFSAPFCVRFFSLRHTFKTGGNNLLILYLAFAATLTTRYRSLIAEVNHLISGGRNTGCALNCAVIADTLRSFNGR